jgi:nitrogen fixation NifU-like protein
VENLRLRQRHCFHQYSFRNYQGNEYPGRLHYQARRHSGKAGGLPDYKIHCSVLGDKSLRAAIDDYLAKTGKAGMLKEEATEICHCLGVTDKDIEDAYNHGVRTWEQLQEATKIGTVCGGCKEKALELLHEFAHIYGT